MDWKRYITERNVFLSVIILGILILLIPPLVRVVYFDRIPTGDTPYYHERIASTMLTVGIPKIDDAVVGGRVYHIQPYHLVLAGVGWFLGIRTASFILPFLLGMAALLLYYAILKRLEFSLEVRFLSMVILILSPGFIASFSRSDEIALLLFLQLLSFFLFIKKNKYAPLVYALLPFFGAVGTLIAAIAALLYTYLTKNVKQWFFVVAAMILISIIFPTLALKNTFAPLSIITLQALLSDLGGEHGLGIFNIVLFFIGFVALWKKYKVVFLTVLLSFIASLLWYTGLYTMNFPLAVIAAMGFLVLLERKWNLHIIKELTVLIVICGLLFSGISYLNRTVHADPSPQLVKSFEWFGKNLERSDMVLTIPEYGFWITALSNARVLLDGRESDLLLKEDLDTIYSSRNIEQTKTLLNKYSITHILITPYMKNGGVWSGDSQGLLFVLKNSESFIKVYGENDIEIWLYLPKE